MKAARGVLETELEREHEAVLTAAEDAPKRVPVLASDLRARSVATLGGWRATMTSRRRATWR